MFLPAASAKATVERVDGQVVEKRIQFSLWDLDYEFVSSANDKQPTLVYVGDDNRGRLSPAKYADPSAWHIALAKFAGDGWIASEKIK